MELRKKRWAAGLFALLTGLFLLMGCIGCKQQVEKPVPPQGGPAAEGTVTGSPLKLTMLSVGKADAMLLQIDGKNYLIDTGLYADGKSLVSRLRALGADRIDGAFLTHPHRDHIGGMIAVLNSLPVERLYVTDVENESSGLVKKIRKLVREKNVPVTRITAPTEVELAGGAKLKVFWPEKAQLAREEDPYININSLVMRLTYKGFSMMFTGDSYTQTEGKILELYKPAELKSNILKVAHHSNRTSTSKEWLEAVAPEAALISCGNEPGEQKYPRKTILSRLKKKNIKIYDTFNNGNITVLSDGAHYSIRTEK